MIESIIKKLTKFESNNIGNANEALSNSISGGYQGLFEPKGKSFANKSVQTSSKDLYDNIQNTYGDE